MSKVFVILDTDHYNGVVGVEKIFSSKSSAVEYLVTAYKHLNEKQVEIYILEAELE